jgi:hypothetical protein
MPFAVASDGERVEAADRAKVWYIYTDDLISTSSVDNDYPEVLADRLEREGVSVVFALAFPFEYRQAFLRRGIRLYPVVYPFTLDVLLDMIREASNR